MFMVHRKDLVDALLNAKANKMDKRCNLQCNNEVYQEGIEVFFTHTIDAEDVERWVQKIAEESGQKVDWHYYAGRAIVLAIGDTEKVKAAICNNRQMHDEMYSKAVHALGVSFTDEFINVQLEDMWRYNKQRHGL